MMNFISSLVTRFINWFKSDLSVFDKAKQVITGVDNALAVFSTLVKELETANDKLKAVVDEADKVIGEHSELKEKAQCSMAEYETILTNIGGIVGGKKNE